ncbi:hypothetical protein J0X15_16085 [Roseibium sp. CAU 1637]|uniref:Uncharacterized protein n=1 Tax=Roseibium limicola TaxID=2816037 RepID=A0A939J818_9HYPH|nr:hypothetical protein [Roseibium limicola]MBO0346747.1 hypothetical protein [Roseibium limicola]
MKLIWSVIALFLFALGLATVWLPIPTGVPLMAFGLILLIGSSRKAARTLRKRRKTGRRLNSLFIWIEDRTPSQFARILRRTRPATRPTAPQQQLPQTSS